MAKEKEYFPENKKNKLITSISEAERQRNAVRAMYEGTEKWLKAPNGKQTNLTEEQWVAIRTPNFKRWFGNWDYDGNKEVEIIDMTGIDLSSHGIDIKEISQLKEWLNENLIGRTIINEDSKIPTYFSNKGTKDSLKKRGFEQRNAYSILDDLLKNAIYFDFEKNDGQKKHSHVYGQDVYYAAFKFNDEIYAVKIKCDINSKSFNSTYKDHKVTEIKIADYAAHRLDSQTSKSYSHISAIDNFTISQLVGGVKPSVSQVIDENGEPLVVYHGTNVAFDTFNKSDAIFFSKSIDYAESMAEERGGEVIYNTFLNIRNPLPVLQLEEDFSDPVKEVPFIEKAKNDGYDGICFSNDTKNELTKDTFYAAFNPNQIKSATDNNGNFDINNESILFQVIGEHRDQSNEKRNVALEQTYTQGDKTMPGEQKDLYISEDQALRIQLAREIKQNMPNLTDGERAAAIAILEAGAASQKMSLTDYVQQTFPNGVFGDYEKAQNAAHQQGVEINGAVSVSGFGANARAVIYASKTADFSTWCHELSHIWQAQLTGTLKSDAEKAFQVQNGNWQESIYTFADGHTDTSAEAFAYGFEDFLKHKAGEMATKDKKAIFEKFADYMSRTYNGVKQNIEMSEEIAKVYEAFVQLDDNVLAEAEKAVRMEKEQTETYNNAIQIIQNQSVSLENTEHKNKKEVEEIFSNLKSITNANDLRNANFAVNTVGKILDHKGYDISTIAENLGELYRTSRRIITESEIKKPGHKEHPNFVAYHHYLNKFKDSKGDEYFIRFTLNEEKARNGKGRNIVHSTFISDVSIYKKTPENNVSGIIDPGEINQANNGVKANVSGIIDPGKGIKTPTDKKLMDFLDSVNVQFQAAYHGSGASFEQFDTEHYGLSGEGSMSFGWGTYLTESEAIARDYADRQNGSGNRNLYTVSIPDGKYLEWEKELTENESKHLVENYSNYFEYLTEDEKQEEAKQYVGKTGQEIYSHFENLLGSEKETSTFLHDIGYTGIKYPAGTIHGNGNGAYNYVIFNDDDIEIKEHLQFQTRGPASEKHNVALEEKYRNDFKFLNNIMSNGSGTVENKNVGEITFESGETGKSGYGIRHIIEQRCQKDGKNVDEITALMVLVKEVSENGRITRENGRNIELQTENGIVSIVRKESDDKPYKWVLTGFDDFGNKEAATDAIQTVIAQYGYLPEYSSFRTQVGAVIASLNQNITQNEEKSINIQGEKNMAQEKQIIAEIGFADGEIKQYEDSKEFLDDLNTASKENAYDTSFRVYAESDELKQKASDVKIDNYDPIEAAERMYNGYEWNDVEHEEVSFKNNAEGRMLLKDAENGRLTILDARDILETVEKNGMTLRYDPLPNSYVVDGWTAADGEKLDNYVVSMSELKRLAGIEISENSRQNQIQEKKTARTPEEEQAYQEWLEMLEDNQQAEDRMERMQGVPPEEQKPLPEWQQRLNATINQAAEMDGVKNSIKAALYDNAEKFTDVPFSREGYERLFQDGVVQSPLETIHFADNQFDVKDQEQYLLAAYQTLSNPDLIYAESENQDNLESRNYVKTFVFGEDEKSALDIVVKTIDGQKVMISAKKRSLEDLIDRIKQPEQLVYMSEEIKQAIDRRSPEEKQRLKDVLPKLRIVPENTAYDKEKAIATARNFAVEKRNVALEAKPELSFPDQVDAVLAGKNDRFNALKVCDTPELLLQAGLKQLPMLYTARHLREAIQPKDLHNHTHGIKVEQIKALPKLLEEPVMIYDSLSRPDSIIVLTSEFDEDKMPIVVSIRPDGKGTYSLEKVDSNFVTSVYGRENFEKHINSVIDNRNLLYWNKGKSQVLFSVLGQQLPKGLNNLDPNRILHQTNSVVNTKSISTQEEKTMERENEKPTQKQELSQDKDVQENNIQKAVSRAKIQHDEVNVYGTPSGTVTLDFTGNPDAFQQITGTDTAPYMNNSEGKPFRAEISMRIQDDGNIHAEVILPSLINDTTKNYRLEELLKANSREFSGDLKATLEEKFREQTGITANLFTGTEKRNVALEDEKIQKENAPQPSLAQDIIERENRKEKWRASHGKALPTDKKDLASEQKKPESKQHSPQKSSAKDYIRRVSEQFLKDIEQGRVPFMRGEEVGDNILIKVKAVRNAVTGRALTGFQQLLAQDMINKLVEKGVLKRMEHELVTYEQAKECGTFIKKGSPHIILPVYNEKTNEASLQMYYFKSGCKEPEKIELANDKVRREAYIKRLRVRLSNAEKERMLTQNEKDELYNMIANAHQAILVYMEAMHQNVSVYRSSLPKHEQEALRKVEELEKNKVKKAKEESLQELIKESMERRHRMEDEEARRQEEKPIYFDARKTASYESYLGTVMAAATVDGNVVASKDVINTVVQTLTPVMRQAFNQFDYMKGFDIGKIMNSKCKENLRDYRRNSIDNLQKSQAMEKVLAFQQGGQMSPPDRNAVEVETYSM